LREDHHALKPKKTLLSWWSTIHGARGAGESGVPGLESSFGPVVPSRVIERFGQRFRLTFLKKTNLTQRKERGKYIMKTRGGDLQRGRYLFLKGRSQARLVLQHKVLFFRGMILGNTKNRMYKGADSRYHSGKEEKKRCRTPRLKLAGWACLNVGSCEKTISQARASRRPAGQRCHTGSSGIVKLRGSSVKRSGDCPAYRKVNHISRIKPLRALA